MLSGTHYPSRHLGSAGTRSQWTRGLLALSCTHPKTVGMCLQLKRMDEESKNIVPACANWERARQSVLEVISSSER